MNEAGNFIEKKTFTLSKRSHMMSQFLILKCLNNNNLW